MAAHEITQGGIRGLTASATLQSHQSRVWGWVQMRYHHIMLKSPCDFNVWTGLTVLAGKFHLPTLVRRLTSQTGIRLGVAGKYPGCWPQSYNNTRNSTNTPGHQLRHRRSCKNLGTISGPNVLDVIPFSAQVLVRFISKPTKQASIYQVYHIYKTLHHP